MVRVSAKNIVGRDAVAKLVQQLADEANLEFEDYELRPRITENSQYRIHFLGAAGTAKTKASQFLASLRRNDDTYKSIDITRPRGGTEHLFFNPDRSKTDIAKSRNIKILRFWPTSFPCGTQAIPSPLYQGKPPPHTIGSQSLNSNSGTTSRHLYGPLPQPMKD